MPDRPVDAARHEETCAACGASRNLPLWRVSGYPIVRCAACGFRWVPLGAAGVPTGLYASDYFEGKSPLGYRGGYDALPAEAHHFPKILDGIGRIAGAGTLLDVGCAYGFFLEAARARGWKVRGVDLSEHAAARARERLGPVVWTGTVEAVPPGEGPFDAVTMLDVIEHLVDPAGTLRLLHGRLRRGGAILVRTGDGGSWAARWLGPRWPMVKPPEHLSFFAAGHVAALLRRTGFAPVRMEWSGGLGFGMRARLAPRRPRPAGGLGRLKGPLIAAAKEAVAMFRAGDIVHVYARRRPS